MEMYFQFSDIFACCLILTFNIFSFLVEHKLMVSLIINVEKAFSEMLQYFCSSV